MNQHSPPSHFYVPPLGHTQLPLPRISGTAVVGGVHLSTGNYGTVAPWRLFLSGIAIAGLLGIGMAMTYVEAWVLDRLLGTSIAPQLLGLSLPHTASWPWLGNVAELLLPMANFLVVLRLSALSGYHAAEHKVVAAIETSGQLTWEEVARMPRAHPRCGTVLLFGLLPTMLVAYPLLTVNPLAALAVAVSGWMLRYRIGYFIQQYLTTKPPTPPQLRAGIEAGRKLLHQWYRDPYQRVSPFQSLWNRGLPQLLLGVILGQQILSFVQNHLHVWLDW